MKSKLVMFSIDDKIGVYHITYEDDKEGKMAIKECFHSFLEDHGLPRNIGGVSFVVLSEHIAFKQYLQVEKMSRPICLN